MAQPLGRAPSRPGGAGTGRHAAGTPLDRELLALLSGSPSATSDAMPVVRLEPQTIEAIAARVAQLLAARLEPPVRTQPRLLSAAEVAEWWGVERSWVYAHAEQLGAGRLGTGRRPRLRFDPELVAAQLAASGQTGRDHGVLRPTYARRSPRTHPPQAELVEILGASELSSPKANDSRPGGARTPPATAPKTKASAR